MTRVRGTSFVAKEKGADLTSRVMHAACLTRLPSLLKRMLPRRHHSRHLRSTRMFDRRARLFPRRRTNATLLLVTSTSCPESVALCLPLWTMPQCETITNGLVLSTTEHPDLVLGSLLRFSSFDRRFVWATRAETVVSDYNVRVAIAFGSW